MPVVDQVTRPPFTYFGGKTNMARRIVAHLPAHEHYVEPFAGSLAVLLQKPRARVETVNDINGEIVRFWRVLRDRPLELEFACALTPHSRGEHHDAYEETDNDVEAARRTWVKLTQGRSSQLRATTGWCVPSTGPALGMSRYLAAYVDRILPCAERIAGVSLENRPALEVIATYGKKSDALIYADPPYLTSTRTRSPNAYAVDMGDVESHIELLTALRDCSATVVLSGYPSSLYDETLADWRRVEFAAFTGQGHADGKRREVLWINRQENVA